MLGLANSVRQLRHLACRRVSLTTLSSIKIPILVLFYWQCMWMILSSLRVILKAYCKTRENFKFKFFKKKKKKKEWQNGNLPK